MTSDPRTLIDWLVVRAWIEPDQERRLRVLIRHPGNGHPETERRFADSDEAASFLGAWLKQVEQRWADGERFVARRRWGPRAHPARNGHEFKG